LLDYCKRLNVALDPFVQLNYNTLLHASGAFGGQPQRLRVIKADFQGEVAELLAKVTAQGKLDEAISTEDKEILLQALKSWGALDNNYAYKASLISADVRGYAKGPAGLPAKRSGCRKSSSRDSGAIWTPLQRTHFR
jgi:monoamine oxidase